MQMSMSAQRCQQDAKNIITTPSYPERSFLDLRRLIAEFGDGTTFRTKKIISGHENSARYATLFHRQFSPDKTSFK